MSQASWIPFLSAADPLDKAFLHAYDLPWVVVSVLLAVFASFCALETAHRRVRGGWSLVSAGLLLGLGTWAMHFIGLLSFRLECTVGYDPVLTAVSALPGMLASVVALRWNAASGASVARLWVNGGLLGTGVGLMHYTGMAAMRLDGVVRYDLGMFVLSILAAVVLAVSALWAHRRLSAMGWAARPFRVSLVSGTILGLAISSMHYVTRWAWSATPFRWRPGSWRWPMCTTHSSAAASTKSRSHTKSQPPSCSRAGAAISTPMCSTPSWRSRPSSSALPNATPTPKPTWKKNATGCNG